MPRTKGSKNKPKAMITDFASQIIEKQETIGRYTGAVGRKLQIASVATQAASLPSERQFVKLRRTI